MASNLTAVNVRLDGEPAERETMARTATSDERLVLAQFEDFVNLNGTRLLHTAYGLCGGLAACRGSGPEGSGDRGGAMVADHQ
jgi:hypothetical protein